MRKYAARRFGIAFRYAASAAWAARFCVGLQVAASRACAGCADASPASMSAGSKASSPSCATTARTAAIDSMPQTRNVRVDSRRGLLGPRSSGGVLRPDFRAVRGSCRAGELRRYVETARVAWPPFVLLTVTLPGFDGQLSSRRPLESVPISCPVDAT